MAFCAPMTVPFCLITRRILCAQLGPKATERDLLHSARHMPDNVACSTSGSHGSTALLASQWHELDGQQLEHLSWLRRCYGNSKSKSLTPCWTAAAVLCAPPVGDAAPLDNSLLSCTSALLCKIHCMWLSYALGLLAIDSVLMSGSAQQKPASCMGCRCCSDRLRVGLEGGLFLRCFSTQCSSLQSVRAVGLRTASTDPDTCEPQNVGTCFLAVRPLL